MTVILPDPQPGTRLQRILALLYRQNENDVLEIQQQLMEQRKRAWRTTIQLEARALGYTGPVHDPRYQDLQWMKEDTLADARSIVNTWNRQVTQQINRLYEANPRGNRSYYIKNLEQWVEARAVWKSRQIAYDQEYKTAAYAKERFWQENGLRGGRYKMGGPPPVCEICIGHFAAGVVDQRYVDANPTPIHLGCPHTWELMVGTVPAPDLADLWVG